MSDNTHIPQKKNGTNRIERINSKEGNILLLN